MAEYSSCWWLQDHVEFSLSGGLQACCFAYVDDTGATRGMLPLTQVSEDRFPAEALRLAKQQVHAEIAAGAHPHCTKCPALTRKEWPEKKYLLTLVTMNIWSHCNLLCEYCFTVVPGFKYSRVGYDSVAVIGDMLAGNYLDPAGRVTWGGGDISALPEFNTLADMFIQYGVQQDFKTSAVKFLSGVANAIGADKGLVEVSIDAGTKETYAKYKGKDVYEKVIANILRYREHGDVSLKYIIDKPNCSDEDIEGWIKVIDQVKPRQIMLTPEFNKAWGKQHEPATIRQMAKFIHATQQTGFTVVPSKGDIENGPRLFPYLWQEVDQMLEEFGAQVLPPRDPARGLQPAAV
jgi:sulfatase maturation enzyme AslB (radical SAM superfamily)